MSKLISLRLSSCLILLGVIALLSATGDLQPLDAPSQTALAEESVSEAWVARYDGPVSGWDGAVALAVDASGNVYVTGDSHGSGTNYDYATVKYGPDGSEEWVARYDGPGTYIDWVHALAVDGSGNVYITGESSESRDPIGWHYDYATIKYGPDGSEKWVARYDGPPSDNDIAYALAVDVLGNVYVTGYSDGNGTSYDYATVKYGPDGSEKWVARYDGPGSGHDVAYALAVDGSGNVYVTGHSDGNGTDWDYATVKYGPDGGEEWVARYDGPGSGGTDEAHALAVGGSGNVYVTGESWAGPDTRDDYATIKYGSDGSEQWVARYDGPPSSDDRAYVLAVDASENVYVAGESLGSGTSYDYATVKYGSDGSEQWVARYDGLASDDDTAEALALDVSGNVYVTGYSASNGTYYDYATVKYDPDGSEQWVMRYDGPASDWDSASALLVDGSGNVYVTGDSEGSGTDRDYATIKYAPPSAVGGIAQLPNVSDSSGRNYVALTTLAAAALLALTVGAWYARRRWVG